MPRKPRVEYFGAFYHVITRGNQRQNLFPDDKDREFYLDRLEQYRKRYGFTIYAYVLMSNHVHLLIETGKTPLSTIMQGLQFSYTRYFNRRGMTVKELGKRLNRDPSIISRLYSAYTESRDSVAESRLLRKIGK
jgi:REP element-mobilizing transposase RayT